jgi:phage/plasmid-like protein (TIGR03299 family)
MSAEFESGFVGRQPAWHGLGIVIKDTLDSTEALATAGLDWAVEGHDVIVDGRNASAWKASVRDRDGALLGIVGRDYRYVQPREAFAFTDELLAASDTRYETAGSLYGGRRIWLLARMPETEIAGSAVAPYVFFTTTFDGSTSTIAGMTPTVIVCANTLSYAIGGSPRTWRLRHSSTISGKVAEAQRTLGLAGAYMKSLAADAETLRQRSLSRAEVQRIVDQVWPGADDEEATPREKANVRHFHDQFWEAFAQPDLDNYNVFGQATGWTVMQAMADVASHLKPVRRMTGYEERRWGALMDGSELLSRARTILEAA